MTKLKTGVSLGASFKRQGKKSVRPKVGCSIFSKFEDVPKMVSRLPQLYRYSYTCIAQCVYSYIDLAVYIQKGEGKHAPQITVLVIVVVVVVVVVDVLYS